MRTEPGLDRLVTFLDVVVAIAITLLVLPLIEVLTEERGADLGVVRSYDLGQFGAFASSLVVVARL